MAFIAHPVISWLILMLPIVPSGFAILKTISSRSHGVVNSSTIIQRSSDPCLSGVNVRSIMDVVWPLVGLVARPDSLLYIKPWFSIRVSCPATSLLSLQCTFHFELYDLKSPRRTVLPSGALLHSMSTSNLCRVLLPMGPHIWSTLRLLL